MPLHPAIVHSPIALFITAFILQALHIWRPYWICRTTSMWLLGFGVLASFWAILSGQQEAIKIGEGRHSLDVLKAIQKHELIAQITTWSSLIIFSMVVPFF